MQIISRARKSLKRIVLGPGNFPQQCAIGMRDPQEEVAVWLHGRGAPRDVTFSHLMACGAPLTIAIGGDGHEIPPGAERANLSLQFWARGTKQRRLGEIGLRYSAQMSVGSRLLHLFHVRNYRNCCLPKHRLWARYALWAYQRWRAPNSDVPITARDVHAMTVLYTCPRPVVLVSVKVGTTENIFPMNLMGPIGEGYFAFALNSRTPVCALVEQSGSIALSTIPVEQTPVAFQLGKNHRRDQADWSQLQFATEPSSLFALPVPKFSLRVREMTVEAAKNLGSHTLFVARTVEDELWANGLECFVVHGIYQAWRLGHTTGPARGS